MLVPLFALCLYHFGYIPRTEPQIVKKYKLRELKNLPTEWENDTITTRGVISTMNDFSRAFYETNLQPEEAIFTLGGMKSVEDIFRKYLGGDTGKDLLLISRKCIVDAFVKRFKLDEVQNILENWKGENVIEIRTTLSYYIYQVDSFTSEEEDELKITGFFTGLEDVIESYLGTKNYKTLEIMILFFEKMDQLTHP